MGKDAVNAGVEAMEAELAKSAAEIRSGIESLQVQRSSAARQETCFLFTLLEYLLI